MFKMNSILGSVLIAQIILAAAQLDDNPDELISANLVLKSKGHEYVLKPVYVRHYGPNVGDASLVDLLERLISKYKDNDATPAPPNLVEDSSSEEDGLKGSVHIGGSGLQGADFQHFLQTVNQRRPIQQNGNPDIVGWCNDGPCTPYYEAVKSVKQNKNKELHKKGKLFSTVHRIPLKISKSPNHLY